MLRGTYRRAHTSLSRLAGGWLTTPDLAYPIEDLFNQARGTVRIYPINSFFVVIIG